jgi:RHS repeat-associated protein
MRLFPSRPQPSASSHAQGRRARRRPDLGCSKLASGLATSRRPLATRSRRPECQTGAEVSPRRNCDFAADPGVDPVTGLIYLDNRYYDPTTGQFLSVDPLNAMTQQPYSYTDDDPINGTDPTGLLCLSAPRRKFHLDVKES